MGATLALRQITIGSDNNDNIGFYTISLEDLASKGRKSKGLQLKRPNTKGLKTQKA